MEARWPRTSWCEGLLLLSIVILIIRCPYSKVEESFNTQAVHDFLHAAGVYDRGHNRIEQFQSFDHMSFPGVVPRTAVGALLLSLLQYPIEIALRCVAKVHLLKMTSQYACRLLLGSASWASIVSFAGAFGDKIAGVDTTASRRIRGLLVLLIAVSFHVPFYSSRTLPNTFASILVQTAWGAWLRGRPYTAIGALTAAATIFRCDMIVLLAPFGIQLLASREVDPFRAIATGVIAVISSLLVSVPIDSLFWGRPLWPEGIVLFFNTVQNKSSEWGVMPWHWYSTSAIPRALHFNLVLCALGVVGIVLDWESLFTAGSSLSSRVRGFVRLKGVASSEALLLAYYLLPPIIFIGLYSFLPHKELRFILPVIPLLASPAAVFLHNALPKDGGWLFGAAPREKRRKRGKGTYPVLLAFLLAIYMSANLYVTEFVYTAAAVINYPGGVALHRLLSSHIPDAYDRSLKAIYSCHIDEAAAMTGVSRFGQENDESRKYGVVYSKEEKLQAYRQFDFLLTGDKEGLGKGAQFNVIEEIAGFSSLEFKRPKSISDIFTIIRPKQLPAIYILKNKSVQ